MMSRVGVGVDVGGVAAVDVPGADLADPQALRGVVRADLRRPRARSPRQRSCDVRAAVVEPAGGRAPSRSRACEPGMPVSARACERCGIASSSARVYGCAGWRKIASRGPSSMICPAYITATRSAMLATTARSWVTYSAATRWLRHSSPKVSQHHALGGDVQPGGRLVEHQHLGPRQERHRQRDALHLPAGQLVRVAGAGTRRRRAGRPRAARPWPRRGAPRPCRCRAAPAARRSAGRCGSLGLRAEAGSCGTYAISSPRSCAELLRRQREDVLRPRT